MLESDIAIRRYRSLVILGIALPFLLISFLSLIFLSHDQSFFYRLICSRFLIWSVLGIMFLFARYGEAQRFLLWEETEYGFLFYLKWIILLYLLSLAAQVIAAVPYRLGLHEKNEMMRKMQDAMKQYPGVGLFAAVTAGITEELYFRGYVMSRLAIFFKSSHLQVLISAALFSIMHIGYHHTGEIIFTLLIGIIFGYHYQRYRNLKVLMVVHFMIDAVATLIVHHYK